MTDLICRITAWLRLVFAPGSGRRRAGVRPTAAAPVARLQRDLRGQPARFGPGWGWTARPLPPYGLRETFDGDTVALVPPYLVAHERRQQRRCLTVVMAAHCGIGLDIPVLHGAGAAR